MSSSVILPPPSSASVQGQGTSLAHRMPRLTERAKALLTAVNLHYAGVAALLVFVLYLALHLVFTIQALHAADADAQARQRITLRAAQIAAEPLRGIDVKIANSTKDANEFSLTRLPYETSQIAAELGALTQKQNIRLSRVQYAYAPVLSGAGALTEARLDASLSGDYRPLVEFINSLERDKMFFVINGITLTGGQSGAVNLRMRLTTYLRSPVGDEETAAAAAVPAAANGAAAAAGTGGAQ